MRHRSAGKENADVSNNFQKKGRNSKSLFKKKAPECFFAVDSNVECKSNDGKNHEVIVDEMKPPPHTRQKKESNHIGQEAFLPVSLETLRRTLNKRIKAASKCLY